MKQEIVTQYTMIKNVKMKVNIDFKLEQGAWQIYSSQAGWEDVEKELTNAAKTSINLAWDNVDLGYVKASNIGYNKFNEIAAQYSRFGATDTEPREVFSILMDKFFPKTMVHEIIPMQDRKYRF